MGTQMGALNHNFDNLQLRLGATLGGIGWPVGWVSMKRVGQCIMGCSTGAIGSP